jgi:hypothetical protein
MCAESRASVQRFLSNRLVLRAQNNHHFTTFRLIWYKFPPPQPIIDQGETFWYTSANKSKHETLSLKGQGSEVESEE